MSNLIPGEIISEEGEIELNLSKQVKKCFGKLWRFNSEEISRHVNQCFGAR